MCVNKVSEVLFNFPDSGQLLILSLDFFEKFVLFSSEIDFSFFLVEFLFVDLDFFHDGLLLYS